MRRYDTKYILPRSYLPDLLLSLCPHYQLTCYQNRIIQRYETIYFDDADFSLYNDHQRGKLNRFKIRMRYYPTTITSFLEIKQKTNHQTTIKSRFSVPFNQYESGSITETDYSLLQDCIDSPLLPLSVTLCTRYTRIALISNNTSERLTLDMDLRFFDDPHGCSINPGNFIVAEIKQERPTLHSPFRRIMKKRLISSRSFSKYCFGVFLLYPQVKHNLFKENYGGLCEKYH